MMATFVARCAWLIVPTTMLVTPEMLSTKFRFFSRLYSLKRPLFNAFFTRTPLFFDSAFLITGISSLLEGFRVTITTSVKSAARIPPLMVLVDIP